MAEKELIRMSREEVRRYGVIQRIMEGGLKKRKAGEILGVSKRQVWRMIKAVKQKGPEGLIHGNRGRIGNRGHKEKDIILKIVYDKYPDFGPTLASEKLLERHKKKVDHDVLRKWLLADGSRHEWKRKSRPHRKWRERRENFGEMVQMDGSHHDWLEGRGPRLVLMGYVDDATGEKFGKFYLYEGTVPAMDSFKEYVEKYGVPMSVYLDRHSTYKTTRKSTIFEELNDEEALTQFERAMKELRVEVIHAHSAPAKGRVEKFFKTMQDRLVKEMRLAGIKTLEEANAFLKKYLVEYNKRFRVEAKDKTNLHRAKPSNRELLGILCKKYKQILRKDSTVYFDKRVFLITNRISNRAKHVDLEERLDGSIRMSYKGRILKYKEIAPSIRVKSEEIEYTERKEKRIRKRKSSVPAKNHPWRKSRPDYYIDSCDYESLAGAEVCAGV